MLINQLIVVHFSTFNSLDIFFSENTYGNYVTDRVLGSNERKLIVHGKAIILKTLQLN